MTIIKKALLVCIALVSVSLSVQAQSNPEAVKATIMDYIEGTANGDIERIKRAFTATAALYAVNPDGTLKRIPIDQYIGFFKPNEKTGRVGKILTMDIENDAATVKVEILSGPWRFTDYMLLLKLEEGWKIINKSYTRVRRN